ncbi:hypothetical protein K435DRAFT_869833 [Dendrothele bispora CBS 962.96]|uniref:Uncharacterized protein n=1 Tax=Dendrothele bispora (strain CBS 962.96) TaxID=1314807 RepID=A0A4S8L876_DENBC|nr:hypothetical protein K435DRAFT_869833 [Dendrothele bispora CBS 962.96]
MTQSRPSLSDVPSAGNRRCSRILRFKHFVPVSLITKYEQSGLTPEIFSKLTKSCDKCRASATQRNARKRAQAEAAGQHWSSCQNAAIADDFYYSYPREKMSWNGEGHPTALISIPCGWGMPLAHVVSRVTVIPSPTTTSDSMWFDLPCLTNIRRVRTSVASLTTYAYRTTTEELTETHATVKPRVGSHIFANSGRPISDVPAVDM